jgi:hypothetical protein
MAVVDVEGARLFVVVFVLLGQRGVSLLLVHVVSSGRVGVGRGGDAVRSMTSGMLVAWVAVVVAGWDMSLARSLDLVLAGWAWLCTSTWEFL